jgi:hypothetical protein
MDEQAWIADYGKVDKAVKPYVVRDVDGDYLSPECPAALSGLYSRLLSIGYLNGWIRHD